MNSLPDRARRAVVALREPLYPFNCIANTVRQSLADVIEELTTKAYPPAERQKRDIPCGDCVDGYCTMNCGPQMTGDHEEGKR